MRDWKINIEVGGVSYQSCCQSSRSRCWSLNGPSDPSGTGSRFQALLILSHHKLKELRVHPYNRHWLLLCIAPDLQYPIFWTLLSFLQPENHRFLFDQITKKFPFLNESGVARKKKFICSHKPVIEFRQFILDRSYSNSIHFTWGSRVFKYYTLDLLFCSLNSKLTKIFITSTISSSTLRPL